MEHSNKSEKEEQPQLWVIADPRLSGCIERANELHVTKDEIVYITPVGGSFAIIYFR